MVRKVLLLSGILSLLVYVAMNILVPVQYAGYSSVAQTISKLSAIRISTRSLWASLGFVYTFLIAAFGWVIYKSATQNRILHIVGVLMLA